MKSIQPVLALGCLVVAVACSDDLGPGNAFDAEDAAIIALETDALTGTMILAQMDNFGVNSSGELAVNSADEREFTRSRTCPAGGTVTITGVADRTVANGVAEFSVTAQGVWDDCARARGTRMLTIDGTFSLEAHRRRAAGEFSGTQTTTKSGSFTWTRGNGDSGTCEFSVTTTRDPQNHQRHVEGTVCGRNVSRDVNWQRGEG
jgi:hypothetical protein